MSSSQFIGNQLRTYKPFDTVIIELIFIILEFEMCKDNLKAVSGKYQLKCFYKNNSTSLLSHTNLGTCRFADGKMIKF